MSEQAVQCADDVVTAALAYRFLATLGYPAAIDTKGHAAPIGLLWCLAPETPPNDVLGPDGLALSHSLLAGLKLPYRMWAGARIERGEGAFPIGAAVERRSRITAERATQGRSGRLIFLDITHEFAADGVLAMSCVESVVCRQTRLTFAPSKEAPPPASGRLLRALEPGQAMLLRFSAITFNAHRIHVDRPYCREIEGYPDLLVHGTLTASLLLEEARRAGLDGWRSATLRALRPAFCKERMEIFLEQSDAGTLLTARNGQGFPVMTCTLA